MPRFLIVDGYDATGRQALTASGATLAGHLYRRMLAGLRPNAEMDILYAADRALPEKDLSAYDAMFWTGSSLTIYHQTAEVSQQIELARAAFRLGLPAFGSCWALQIACVAAGGSCRKNPKGREFGLTRQLQTTPRGARHRVLANRDAPFMGFTSHFDEVESLPQGTEGLLTNAMTQVQAADIHHENGQFFAVQYHPEYDFSEIAALARFRADGLIQDATFADEASLQEFIAACEAVHRTPDNADLRHQLNIDDSVLDQACRQNELRNWLDLHFREN
jgi:GMP synthase (glutamine-hydrolysing)